MVRSRPRKCSVKKGVFKMSQISQEKIFKNMYLEEHLRSSASVKMLLNCEVTMAIFRVNLKFK